MVSIPHGDAKSPRGKSVPFFLFVFFIKGDAMSKSFSCVCSFATSEKPQFDELDEFELSQIIREEREIAALEAEISDRFAFEKDHPFEWSDYGFSANLSNFVFD